MMTDVNFLEQLATLPDSVRIQLLDCAEIHSYTVDQTIVRQSDPPVSFYIVLSGCVEVVRENASDAPQVIQSCMPGDVFCILSLFDNKAHPGTVIARSLTTLLHTRSDAIRALYDDHANLQKILQQNCLTRIRDLIQNAESPNAHLLPERVAYFLLNLSQRQVGYTDGEQILEITDRDAEWMLGASSKHVTRILFQFEELGLLRLHQIDFSIQDYKRLEQIATDSNHDCSFCSDNIETANNSSKDGEDHVHS